MNLLKYLKIKFLLFFRDIFVHHTSSLEFRAKVYASVIAIKDGMVECEELILKDIAKSIYKNDSARCELLVQVTKEYVDKIVEKNELNINTLIKNIDYELKKSSRFVHKINIEELKRFISCNCDDEEITIIQERVIEFLELEIKEYS